MRRWRRYPFVTLSIHDDRVVCRQRRRAGVMANPGAGSSVNNEAQDGRSKLKYYNNYE
jgi:hypothetical protein